MEGLYNVGKMQKGSRECQTQTDEKFHKEKIRVLLRCSLSFRKLTRVKSILILRSVTPLSDVQGECPNQTDSRFKFLIADELFLHGSQ